MTRNPEFGNVTGTKDKDYDIIWFTEACLSNVLRLETYIEDAALAGDDELAEFLSQGPTREPQRCRGGQEATRQAPGGVVRTATRNERSLDGRHELQGLRSG